MQTRAQHSSKKTPACLKRKALKINQLKSSLSLPLSCFHLQLSSGRTHLMPTQAAANSHHSNGLPTHHISGSRVDGWMGDESAGRAGVTAGSQTGAGSRGRGRREEEEGGRGQTHPLEVLSGHPSSLDSTLRHIVQQLDILTQVSYY